MSLFCPHPVPEHASVLSRIRKKKEDYANYGFDSLQAETLLAFFDLAQEYQTLENFYRVSVFVPKEFLGFDACLYVVEQDTGRLKMACDSLNGLLVCGHDPVHDIRVSEEPYELGDSYVVPIKGNRNFLVERPLAKAEEIIALFEIFPRFRLNDKDRLFFQKYANRIGYNLHYKMIAVQNEEHLKFINTLVADIEHNVIVPNMRYKLFLINLRKKFAELACVNGQLREKLTQRKSGIAPDITQCENLQGELREIYDDLLRQYDEIDKHYQNTSLFLESLLRRDHFEKGHLVLKRRMCRFKSEVIDPQLERYRDRLERVGIRIDSHMGGVPDEDIPLDVDLGLISQVYANFFSNAEKYCTEVLNEYGQPVKFLAYGRETLPDFFGPGKPGIKLNVFTTGPHLPPEEAAHVFDEGFRGSGTAQKTGSGHGLHFVKKVVEVHGGIVGYEPTYLGNNFYFVLPVKPPPPPESGPAPETAV